MNLIRRRSRRAPRRGQAMAEFALILPLLLILLLGIIQFGFLFATHLGMINGTREGVRYGATYPTTDGTTDGAVEDQLWNFGANTGALSQAPGFSEGSLVSRTVDYCRYQTPNMPTPYWHVRLNATVTYNHPLFLPVIGALLDGIDSPSTPGAFQVSFTEEMRVENAINLSTPPTVADC